MNKSIEDNNYLDGVLRLNRAFKSYTNEYLKQYDLNMSEMHYLRQLFKEDNVSQEFFSNLYKLNEATVARALLGLEKKGYIKRVPNPNDKRMKMVLLTEKGKVVALELVEHKIDFANRTFANFSDEEFDEFLRLSTKMINNMYDIMG